MKNEIAKKIKMLTPKSLYVQASEKFEVSYDYVRKIAAGDREPTKKKGMLIKAWLLEQIEINKTAQNN
jgi:hypothetical protein